jgi:putative acetyltransferase
MVARAAGPETAPFTIAPEDPRSPESAAMIAALDRRMRELYRPDACHLTTPDQLVAKNALFLAARLDGVAVGCIALVPDGEGTAEIKRVWAAPDARRRGLGRALLQRLEEMARERGVGALRLETGPLQPEAIALFRSQGFRERGPFGGYCNDPELIFMEKILDAESAA